MPPAKELSPAIAVKDLALFVRFYEETRRPSEAELANCREELCPHFFNRDAAQIQSAIKPYISKHAEFEATFDYYWSQISEIYWYLKRREIELTSEHYKLLRKYAFSEEYGMALRAPWHSYCETHHGPFMGQPIHDTAPDSILKEREELYAVQCITFGVEIIKQLLVGLRDGSLNIDRVSELMLRVHGFAAAQNMRLLPSYENKLEKGAVSGKQAERRHAAGQKTREQMSRAFDEIWQNPSERAAFLRQDGSVNVSALFRRIKTEHPEIGIGSERGRKLLSEVIQEKI